MLHGKIEKKAKLLPINILLGTGLVMVAWALADVAHTTTLMPLFPAGIFPLPDSDIIAIVFYHVALGIGIAWAVYTVIMRCVSGAKRLLSLLKKQDESCDFSGVF